MEIRGLGFKENESIKKPSFSVVPFEKELANLLEKVNLEQKKLEALKSAVLKGEDVPMYELVLQSQKAKIALDLLIQVRNKLLEAYQELNRLQV